MTRTEAVTLLALALVMMAVGATMLVGPWALVGLGVVVFLFALLGVNLKE